VSGKEKCGQLIHLTFLPLAVLLLSWRVGSTILLWLFLCLSAYLVIKCLRAIASEVQKALEDHSPPRRSGSRRRRDPQRGSHRQTSHYLPGNANRPQLAPQQVTPKWPETAPKLLSMHRLQSISRPARRVQRPSPITRRDTIKWLLRVRLKSFPLLPWKLLPPTNPSTRLSLLLIHAKMDNTLTRSERRLLIYLGWKTLGWALVFFGVLLLVRLLRAWLRREWAREAQGGAGRGSSRRRRRRRRRRPMSQRPLADLEAGGEDSAEEEEQTDK